MLNTPPVFAVYICMLTLRWLKNQGGVRVIQARNEKKAALLYDTIDRLPIFKGNVEKEDRSNMNACFVMSNPALEQAFQIACKENNMIGVKGHRSTGGFRISMYNALPLESIQAVCNLMTEFATKHS
jgi:phosphoserine aminotransferase